MGATKKRGRPIASRHLVCGTCSAQLVAVRHLGVHHPLGRDEGEHCVQVQGMYGGGEVGGSLVVEGGEPRQNSNTIFFGVIQILNSPRITY